MSTWIKVARYHLVGRINYVVGPVGILTFGLAVYLANLAVFANGKQDPASRPGGLASFYVWFFVLGLLSMVRSLPFALALGVSRRSYYLGTVLLAVTTTAVYGLVLAVLQVAERATGGWGEAATFFRAPWLPDGPWYLTWWESSLGLALVYVYGMWVGLVYRRWDVIGLLAFIVAQVTALLAGAAVATRAGAWPSIGHFLAGLSAGGEADLLAALAAVILLAGGYATVRGVSI